MHKHQIKIVLTKRPVVIHNMDMLKNESKKSITLLSPAKVNLTLEVLGKREDGYHELRTVMHSIGIFDRLIIKENHDDEIRVICNESLPKLNTAYIAAERFKSYTNCPGIDIYIEKHIPSEAGLGGASADAAGVLRGMEALFGRIDENTLYSIGKSVGADVPFCLFGGCALAEGIGEKLTRLQPYKMNLLLVKGERGVSTRMLFNSLDERLFKNENDLENHSQCLIDKMQMQSNTLPLFNDLMKPAIKIVPEIENYMQRMRNLGATATLMTGSGSVVYGIFGTLDLAKIAYKSFEDCSYRCVCRTIPDAIRIIKCDECR